MAVAKKLSFATASVIIYTFVLVKYIKNNLCIYKCSDSDTVGELMLTVDLMRILTILDRFGILG